jgi:prevent-host-death family protein
MDLREDIKSVTYMKMKSAELLQAVCQKHRAVVITQNGEARAVIQDIETYEKNRKALLFLKLMTQSERAVEKGRTVRHKNLVKEMPQWLDANEPKTI